MLIRLDDFFVILVVVIVVVTSVAEGAEAIVKGVDVLMECTVSVVLGVAIFVSEVVDGVFLVV